MFSKKLEKEIKKVLKMGEDLRNNINSYHIEYEEKRIWDKTSWMGVPCWKLPFDAFVIQELIVKSKPEVIIETGTGKGGSAMFYASICELMNKGKVLTVDIDDRVPMEEVQKYRWADRVMWLSGNSVSPLTLEIIKEQVGESKNNMVILDSWHTKLHVYQEMLLYSKFVPVGGYMIVEDSHANGNPVPWKWKDEGPMGAIKQFMEYYGDSWEIDSECEKHLMTFNPKGYLKRIKYD